MYKEYKTIKEVVGPLMLVEGVEGVKYDELVEILQDDGSIRRGKVLEVKDDKVTMDFNHQLAGETVRYAGVVQLVRDATPEELQPKHHGCGCGCEECNDSNCGHDHGDGCNCGGC